MSDGVAVSVIIPCYNSARWLRGCIASVLAQTRRDFEIILVDDGSLDATPAVIAGVRREIRDVPVLALHQPNGGTAAARNLGIAAAQGRYILPLDADDELHPFMLADTMAVLDERAEIDLVYTDRQDFGEISLRWTAGSFQLERLKRFNQLSYCALYRRSLWQHLGGYRCNVSGFDDWDFWLAVALTGAQAHHLPQAYLRHRRREDSQLRGLLDQYETLFARIILNNPAAYSTEELVAAHAFLEEGRPSSMLRASRFLFLKQYYPLRTKEVSCES